VPTLFLSADRVKEYAERLTRPREFGSNGAMSVMMILRIPVDPAALERAARESDSFLEIAEYAKQHGAIHHEFWASTDEVLAVDEWDSPEACRAFFESQAERISQLMGPAGASQPDDPRFYRKLDLGDSF
jgi:heme-degrading monooxygenase HmoA